jgi:long-chain acyl-CoA synthetase
MMSSSVSTKRVNYAVCDEIPLQFESFLALLRNLLAGPRKRFDAFITPEGTVKNDVFVQKTVGLATALKRKWNLEPGDKIALMFWNQPEFFMSLFALRLIGAVPVPINILMTPEDMGYVLQHADVKGILGTEQLIGELAKKKGCEVAQLPFPVLLSNTAEEANNTFEKSTVHFSPNFDMLEQALEAFENRVQVNTLANKELAFLMYTSGTTGYPKGVMLSERNLLANLSGFRERVAVRPDKERFLLGLPAFHCYGLMCALYGIAERATMVCVPKFNPKQIVEFLRTEEISILPLVPTMFTILLQAAKRKIGHAKPFPTLHTCISGGAALPAALLADIERTLQVKVLEGYGLTETSPVIAVNCSQRGSVAGAVGEPLRNVRLRLVNHETGEIIPIEPNKASGEGEIQVAGDSIKLGYYQNIEETQKVLTDDGWFRTGDLGHIDAEGLLRISGGRLKDLIIRAGENIAPLPIERVLSQHEAIANVAVLPLKDEKLGEAICACIELTPGMIETDKAQLEKELTLMARQALTPSMVPDAFRFFDELPKNPTGKIMKKNIVLE